MNHRLIIAPLLAPSSWQASSSMALRKEICDPQYCCLIIVPQPARISLQIFSLRQIFDPDTPAPHSWRFFSWETLLLCDIG